MLNASPFARKKMGKEVETWTMKCILDTTIYMAKMDS